MGRQGAGYASAPSAMRPIAQHRHARLTRRGAVGDRGPLAARGHLPPPGHEPLHGLGGTVLYTQGHVGGSGRACARRSPWRSATTPPPAACGRWSCPSWLCRRCVVAGRWSARRARARPTSRRPSRCRTWRTRPSLRPGRTPLSPRCPSGSAGHRPARASAVRARGRG